MLNTFDDFKRILSDYDGDSDYVLWETIKRRREENNFCDIYTIRKKYITYEYSLVELTEYIRSLFNPKTNTRITGFDSFILIENEEGLVISISSRGDSIGKLNSDFKCLLIGNKEQVFNFIDLLDKKFKKAAANIDWWFMSKHGPTSVSVTLEDPASLHNEFYPWLEEGPYNYFQRFLESSAPILFISGEPGTGKTSYIRNMIHHFQIDTFVGYDNKLFESDAMFIEFLTGTARLMLLEDAETMVVPRKRDNNLISRFLNVSDGLLKLPNKKFIFTTNESNFSNVDHALTRPGRCFDSCEFRPLSFDEAKLAATKVPLPEPIIEKEYTLAELFNPKTKKITRKVGF